MCVRYVRYVCYAMICDYVMYFYAEDDDDVMLRCVIFCYVLLCYVMYVMYVMQRSAMVLGAFINDDDDVICVVLRYAMLC